MIEVHQIIGFLTIIEENSFSRAAEKLGLAQSAVSQKLRRLEDQLGITLIERTSRQLRLSEQAMEFLPYARQIVQAEQNARAAAKRIVQRMHNTLRLGGYAFLADDRLRLIEYYLKAAPNALIEVEHGSRGELLRMLEDEKLDAFICLATVGAPLKEFDYILMHQHIGHIALPIGHPLACYDRIRLDQMSNMPLVVSPGRLDAPVLNWLCEQLTNEGVILVPAPEAGRSAISSFARIHRLPFLRWLPEAVEQQDSDTEILVAIRDNPLVTEQYLYTRLGKQRPLVEEFRKIVREFGRCEVPDSSSRARNVSGFSKANSSD